MIPAILDNSRSPIVVFISKAELARRTDASNLKFHKEWTAIQRHDQLVRAALRNDHATLAKVADAAEVAAAKSVAADLIAKHGNQALGHLIVDSLHKSNQALSRLHRRDYELRCLEKRSRRFASFCYVLPRPANQDRGAP